MKNPIGPDSTIAKHGGTFATMNWLCGNIAVGFADPVLGALFLGGSANGLTNGQTPTGVINQYTMGLLGYTYMFCTMPDVFITIVGGFLATAQGIDSALRERNAQHDMVAQLKEQNAYEQKINPPRFGMKRVAQLAGNAFKAIIGAPGAALRKGAELYNAYTPKPLKKVLGIAGSALSELVSMPGDIIRYTPRLFREKRLDDAARYHDNMNDITQRPLFDAALFGALCDVAFLHKGIAQHDAAIIAASSLWITGWGFTGISLPQEGQKNIFQQWGENIRDVFKGKKKPPSSPGLSTPQNIR